MTISEILHRIEQSTQKGETEILGGIIMGAIEENTEKIIAVCTKEFSSFRGNPCVYIDPRIAKMQFARKFFEIDFEVRLAVEPKFSQQGYDYTILLNRKQYGITRNGDPDIIEANLKREIEILNQLGLNLEYAGQYVPPPQK